jgi:hypothetical protein
MQARQIEKMCECNNRSAWQCVANLLTLQTCFQFCVAFGIAFLAKAEDETIDADQMVE